MLFSLKGALLRDASILPARPRFEPLGSAPVLLRALFTGVRGETVWKILEGFSTVRVWWQKMTSGDSFVSSRGFSILHFRAHFDFPDSLWKGNSRKLAPGFGRWHHVCGGKGRPARCERDGKEKGAGTRRAAGADLPFHRTVALLRPLRWRAPNQKGII